MKEVIVFDKNDIQENKVYAILAYLGILFLVPLLAAKDSPFARYHTNQGVLLFIAGIICNMLAIVPILGWIAAVIGNIIILVFRIIGIINAFKGEAKELPIIGHIEIIKPF